MTRSSVDFGPDSELLRLVEEYLGLSGPDAARHAMHRARIGDAIRAELDRRGGEATVGGWTVRQCGGRLVIEEMIGDRIGRRTRERFEAMRPGQGS